MTNLLKVRISLSILMRILFLSHVYRTLWCFDGSTMSCRIISASLSKIFQIAAVMSSALC